MKTEASGTRVVSCKHKSKTWRTSYNQSEFEALPDVPSPPDVVASENLCPTFSMNSSQGFSINLTDEVRLVKMLFVQRRQTIIPQLSLIEAYSTICGFRPDNYQEIIRKLKIRTHACTKSCSITPKKSTTGNVDVVL